MDKVEISTGNCKRGMEIKFKIHKIVPTCYYEV